MYEAEITKGVLTAFRGIYAKHRRPSYRIPLHFAVITPIILRFTVFTEFTAFYCIFIVFQRVLMYLLRFSVCGWNHRRRPYCVSWYLRQTSKVILTYSTTFCGNYPNYTAFYRVYWIYCVLLQFLLHIYCILPCFDVFTPFYLMRLKSSKASLLRFVVLTPNIEGYPNVFYCILRQLR